MESPQEDEFGLVNLCGLSPYLGAIFARSEKVAGEKGYIKYLSFKVRWVYRLGFVCVGGVLSTIPYDDDIHYRGGLVSALI